MLATKAGITVVRDPEEARKRGRRTDAVEALRRAVEVYHRRLKKAADAGPARSYLRGRGYDVDLIDEWRLGFAGTEWDTLAKESEGGRHRRQGDHGRRSGATRPSRCLRRVQRSPMFPIHDLRGDPIGFGGRKIDEVGRDNTNNPDAKYVNSQDSSIYQKSRVLFGLERARQVIDE